MFRIQPGITEEPVQRTFENVKFSLNAALLTFHASQLIEEIIGYQEMAIAFKIPYFISPETLETTPAWRRGAMTIDVSLLAQNTAFTMYLLAAKFGAAPVILWTKNYNVPAGTRLFYYFSDLLSDVDLREYDGLIIAPEVPVKPIPPHRYVITTQLTFHPLQPLGLP